jgi:uncharacterized protein (TIGR00290 family)
MQRYARLLSWSGGKDAAYALSDEQALFSTYDEATRWLPHTRVPIEAVEAQARALGLPLVTVPLPSPWDQGRYEERLRHTLADLAPGASMAFGDLHLTDLRAAREGALRQVGLVATFPGWTTATAQRAASIVAAGVRAVVVSVDTRALSPDFLVRSFDASLLADLPPEVDPCGERGEFQTFVLDHPRFSTPVDLTVGDQVTEGDHALLQLLMP